MNEFMFSDGWGYVLNIVCFATGLILGGLLYAVLGSSPSAELASPCEDSRGMCQQRHDELLLTTEEVLKDEELGGLALSGTLSVALGDTLSVAIGDSFSSIKEVHIENVGDKPLHLGVRGKRCAIKHSTDEDQRHRCVLVDYKFEAPVEPGSSVIVSIQKDAEDE